MPVPSDKKYYKKWERKVTESYEDSMDYGKIKANHKVMDDTLRKYLISKNQWNPFPFGDNRRTVK